MSFLLSILSTDVWTTLFTIFIGILVFLLAKFYYRVYSLPPGPFPLPIIGNILVFRSKHHWNEVFKENNKKYGPTFTLWMGNTPLVVMSDIDMSRDNFRKNDFAGRPDSYFFNMLSNDKYSDVVATDYGHTWEALRRVAHSAVQKYSTNEKLILVATDSVDNIIKNIVSKEGLNKEFNPTDYLYYLFLNILATSSLGKSYSIDDEELNFFKYILQDLSRELGSRFLLWEFSGFIRFLDMKKVKWHKQLFNEFRLRVINIYLSHLKDYNESIERDFCDALITAKNEALREGKESAPYLKDENLAMVVFDLFFAGTDTSQNTFKWLLLFICYYPEIQKKLRQEIETQIGDRIPNHEDRNRCHYVMAVISETLRLRNVIPQGVPHSAVVDSKLGDYTIPKGTSVTVYQGIPLNNEKHWPNAQEFRPERFIENGKYITTRPKAFIPFGVGRRVCVGEKLAIADLFLVLVRFIQKTSDYELTLGSNGGLEPDPNITDNINPFEYKIIFKSK